MRDQKKFLNRLGGRIKTIGRTILITGCKQIKKEVKHQVIFDRIELGTYMIAGALVGKKLIFDIVLIACIVTVGLSIIGATIYAVI